MKKKLLALTIFTTMIFTGCSSGSTNKTPKASSEYFINQNGVKFTKEEYDSLLLAYDEFYIDTIDTEFADAVKDDRTLALPFDYDIDEKLYKKVITPINSKTSISGEKITTRDEVAKIAKEITDIKYDMINIRIDIYREIWRVKFSLGESADSYQYIYVAFDGTIIAKADVTSDMELSTYSKNTGKPYFTNVNGAEFTEEQYNNMFHAFTEKEIILMEKDKADSCKDDKNLHVDFDYQKDLEEYKDTIKLFNNSELQDRLNRDKIIEKARDYIADLDGTISTVIAIAYLDNSDNIWKIKCSASDKSKYFYCVYLDEYGNVIAYNTLEEPTDNKQLEHMLPS